MSAYRDQFEPAFAVLEFGALSRELKEWRPTVRDIAVYGAHNHAVDILSGEGDGVYDWVVNLTHYSTCTAVEAVVAARRQDT